jgi:hypothetical protein
MHHPPIEETELIKRGVRAKICVRCYQCPHEQATLAADVPRSCERDCTIFANLPLMQSAVLRHLPVLGDADEAVEQIVCAVCHVRPTSGEFCAEFATRTCPLSRYGRDVIELLQRMRDRHVSPTQ